MLDLFTLFHFRSYLLASVLTACGSSSLFVSLNASCALTAIVSLALFLAVCLSGLAIGHVPSSIQGLHVRLNLALPQVDRVSLLERCVRRFRQSEQYHNDERYLRICLKYVRCGQMSHASRHQTFLTQALPALHILTVFCSPAVLFWTFSL